jgi:Tol biopolymer transport system component
LQGVVTFAVRGKSLAVVRDGHLWVGQWDGRQWQGATMLDERAGIFSDLAWSADGQWLAYTYRARSEEPTQLWLAHLPTRRLWQVAVNASAPTFAD